LSRSSRSAILEVKSLTGCLGKGMEIKCGLDVLKCVEKAISNEIWRQMTSITPVDPCLILFGQEPKAVISPQATR
jgi:hypothetical protein